MRNLTSFVGYILLIIAGLFIGFIITVQHMALVPQPIFAMAPEIYVWVGTIWGLVAVLMIVSSSRVEQKSDGRVAAYYVARILGYVCAAASAITFGILWAITVEIEKMYVNNFFYLQSPVFYYTAIVMLFVLGAGLVFISWAIPETEQKEAN